MTRLDNKRSPSPIFENGVLQLFYLDKLLDTNLFEKYRGYGRGYSKPWRTFSKVKDEMAILLHEVTDG